MAPYAWREACRALARARAEVEAVELWAWQARSEPLPFAHRWEHVQEVVRLALLLAAAEGATTAQTQVIEAAAWLHDICKLERQHAARAAEETPAILAATDFPPTLVGAVALAIARHEGMTRPEGAPPLAPLEAAVLWDADKLSKLGVGALMQSVASPYDAGRTLAERRANLLRWAHTTLERTVASFNTPTARAWGARRYTGMLAALAAWEAETEQSLLTQSRQDARERKEQQ